MVREILSFIDDAGTAAPFVKTLLEVSKRLGASSEIGVLTAAPMLVPDLAPLMTFYMPEPVLRADNALEVERTRALVADAADPVSVFGLHDSVGWLSADVRDTRQVADLILIGPQETWLTPWLRRRLIETLLLSSGTPILLLPPERSLAPVRHAVLGWKPSAEAGRVLHDLVALAEPGARIDVVTVGPDPQVAPGDVLPGSGIERHLARHGFAVEMHRADDGRSTAEQLQGFAIERNVDLLAVGGFAHSRIREIVLGGVTRTMIEDPFIPILMAH
ncbi:MAG: universal stress protein [Sphingomonas sp.]|jgi:nucleotide-binding universal stress UspA family protein|uniref:universal stress protein n=1 Tax=Sphingomonas sp. TaxID=28214 RepID=UPI003567554D